ncbi:class I SAM-dependent methyltransferase [Paraburkholderia sp. BR14263]|uniref:class I SAM-dependent methyltransferase n=1 Tax=unclassified Paraburkholderia TaxID=2615204 RepID=UPI0034CF39B1
MDSMTIETYTSGAANYAAEWANQSAPDDLYARLMRYFRPHGRTVDIGCGSGRDVAWLNAHGYPATGYDASEGLIARATADHPQCAFGLATLPELEGVPAASFDNVLCETVIMHLPVAQIGPACRRLVELLEPGGVLYLSWRVTDGDSGRDPAGRLYSSFDPALVTSQLEGTTIALDEEAVNRSSGKRVQRIVAIRA